MLQINGKTFMNLQEAVQWLLDNNALPFQSSANYVANTEIGMGTIVNPSPAKVRIGSLIFFADSKVSTVVGLTENGFICSDQYNDLVDDVVYVSNVALNASGHLIVTLSNGNTIDAGLIKQVTGFSIDGSQHLIVSFNDGTSTDLGAIFSGNITISGTLTVSGQATFNDEVQVNDDMDVAGDFTADSIIENMPSSYVFDKSSAISGLTKDYVYAGIVKTGNKITLAVGCKLTRTGTIGTQYLHIGNFVIPSDIASKIFPVNIGGNNFVDVKDVALLYNLSTAKEGRAYAEKTSDGLGRNVISVSLNIDDINNELVLNAEYYFRYEITILLSDNLAV